MGRARVGGRMSVSDASMTSEWRVHVAHVFMMHARRARVMIAHVIRGVTWHTGGAAWRDATRTRAVGCLCVGGRMSVSDAHHACDHDAHMIFAHHACIMIARVMRGVAWHASGAAWRGAMRRARRQEMR